MIEILSRHSWIEGGVGLNGEGRGEAICAPQGISCVKKAKFLEAHHQNLKQQLGSLMQGGMPIDNPSEQDWQSNALSALLVRSEFLLVGLLWSNSNSSSTGCYQNSWS